MKYLLDTNICILLIRQRSPQVLERLTAHPITEIGISAIAVAELQYGVERSSKPQQNQQALEQFLLPLTILPFDHGTAIHYGRIRAHLESQGLPIGALDTLIAAHAIQHGLTIATSNVREFARVPGLAVENWTQT